MATALEPVAIASDYADITGGRLLARALKSGGIDAVFAQRDGEMADLLGDCAAEGIRVIAVRQELTAVQAAEGYARITGKTGCVLLAAVTGMTTAIAGISTAFHEESALLVIAGIGPSSESPLRDLSSTALLRPITKFIGTVHGAARTIEMARLALRACHDGTPGPSYLEVPHEILRQTTVRMPLPGHPPTARQPVIDERDIEALAALLITSERPCVLFGSQLWTCRAAESARDFCRELGLPAYSSGSARGTFPPGDPSEFRHSLPRALEEADLIIMIGTPDLDRRLPTGIPVVQIDLDARRVGRHHDLDLGVVGDCGVVMRAVLETIGYAEANGFFQRQAWLEELRRLELPATESMLPQQRLAQAIEEFATADTIFICDDGSASPRLSDIIAPCLPGHWFNAGIAGSGMPLALAAKLTHPGQEVLALFTDNSLSAAGFELETCIRLGLPFIGIVINSRPSKGGGIPYGAFARMLSGYGEDIEDANAIHAALQRARASGKCALINIWIDPEPRLEDRAQASRRAA